MKQFLLILAVLFIVVLGSSSVPSIKTAEAATKERATVKFDRPVMLMGIALQGTYLFVHDDTAMGRGEECTYVYKGETESRKKLVVSFHCTPKDRTKADHFMLRSIETPEGQTELTEYQFSGSSEGHVVPLWRHRS
jgi:uncharacterized protein YpmB